MAQFVVSNYLFVFLSTPTLFINQDNLFLQAKLQLSNPKNALSDQDN